MTVGRSPSGETPQRVAVLKDQKISDGEDLLPRIGKAGLEVIRDPKLLSNRVEERGGATEEPA
jgi:hypothetical protein